MRSWGPPLLAASCAAALAALAGAGGCRTWEQVDPPDPTPADDDEPPPEPVAVVPELLAGPVPNPDAGWIATNTNHSWSSLTDRAGGEPFRVASVVYVVGSLREWYAPADGSDPAAVANGGRAGVLAEALANDRYVAFRLYADDPDDLPPAWPTSTSPAEPIPDGIISFVQIGSVPGDDDDSAGDDDDSATDDDDSAGDDDDSAGGGRDAPRDEPIWAPDYSDPDYRAFVGSTVSAIADRFAGEVGLAFVDVAGVGTGGGFDFDDVEPWFGTGRPYTEASWAAQVLLWLDVYEGLFPDVPLYLPYRALTHAGDAADDVIGGLDPGRVGIRDDCAGGCVDPDVTRFPGEGGDPYPSSDPYGGWLPATLHEDHPVLYSPGIGGLGTWRVDAATGAWDEDLYGPFDAYYAQQLDARFRHGPASFLVLSGTPCTSEWVIAASPPATACAPQTSTGVWAPVVDYGESAGYRYVVTEVRLRPDWDDVVELEVELDVTNAGSARAHRDRPVELAFVRQATGEAIAPVQVALETPTSGWLPGESVTLSATLPVAGMQFGAGEAWALTIRLVDDRAFGGGIRLPHPVVGQEARHVLATWPAAPE